MTDVMAQKSEALCSNFRPGCGAILKGSRLMRYSSSKEAFNSELADGLELVGSSL